MASTQLLTKFPHLPNGEAKFKSPPPAHIATKAAQELRKKATSAAKETTEGRCPESLTHISLRIRTDW